MSGRSLIVKFIYPFVVVVAMLAAETAAQSTDQMFPTPVRTNEIGGTIKARDIGDSRLTTYYYTFEGEQGDVFLNVQARNFNGDIDLFAMPGLRPMTKIVMYADTSETETGRVVYLRKPERLLLRIEGRTPGDEDAVFRIKFAGTFAASKLEDPVQLNVQRPGAIAEGGVRVNSVGTIIEPVRRPEPAAAESAETRKVDGAERTEPITERRSEPVAEAPNTEQEAKTEVVRTDELVKKEPEEKPRPAPRRERRAQRPTKDAAPDPAGKGSDERDVPEKRSDPEITRSRNEKREEPVDPMANIRLVIQFKDGAKIERPMNEVMRFAVEKAILTVISKSGSIGKYNMAEIASVSIQ